MGSGVNRQRWLDYRLLIVVILSIGAGAQAQAAGNVLAKRNALTAYIVECAKIASIEITAPDGRLFANTLGDFGVMVGSLKYILPQACPDAEKVTIKGTVNGQLWLAGAVKPADDWKLVSLYAAP